MKPRAPRTPRTVAAPRKTAVRGRGSPSRRAQGRPTEAADAVGPEALINAAVALLKRLPPAKVTRAEVAREANVDPSLIRYYFSDRESLLLAVLHRVTSDRFYDTPRTNGGTAADRLRELVRGFLSFNASYPFVHRLLIEEFAPSSSSAAREAFHSLNQDAIAAYGEIVKEGVKDGSLRRVDPVLLHIAVIGLCEFFLGSRVLLEDALGKSVTPASLTKRYADFITGLVVDGVGGR